MKYVGVFLLTVFLFSGCSKNEQGQFIKNDNPDSSDKLACSGQDPLGCLPLVTDLKDKDYIYRDALNDDSFNPNRDPYQYLAPHSLINLIEINSELNLSENFKVRELMRLQNGPYALFSTNVIYHLEEIRSRVGFPLKINSGYRSPAHNNKVGGSKWSRHIYGDAVDISAFGENRNKIIAVCKNLGAYFTEIYDTHVHCDWRSEALDQKYYPVVVRPDSFIHDHNHQNLEINITKELNQMSLSINGIQSEEDPAHISIQWTVTNLYTQKIITQESLIFNLKVNPGETYQVKALVGGNHLIEKEISF